MIILTTLLFVLLAWMLPIFCIVNMERIDKTEKMFWLLSVLPFSWFSVLALMISGPVYNNHSGTQHTTQNLRHM